MKGVQRKFGMHLSQAIHAIGLECAEMSWLVDLQSGPFREYFFTDNEDSRNLLHLISLSTDTSSIVFSRGIFPNHADDLLIDELSYYLGFKENEIAAAELCRKLSGGPCNRDMVIQLMETYDMIYMVCVDDGMWECYSSNPATHAKVLADWGGREIESSASLEERLRH